jgi:hypothetical protein
LHPVREYRISRFSYFLPPASFTCYPVSNFFLKNPT